MIDNQNQRGYNDSGNDTANIAPSSSQSLVVLASHRWHSRIGMPSIGLGVTGPPLQCLGMPLLLCTNYCHGITKVTIAIKSAS
uniref:Protein-ribulosamine 3-kinaseic isoform X2 n=1 Tax=Rhizophora mucronata TaxID=61149 RepID=A0A2P2LB78_RHIMU